ncbi:MAG: hypothetical protein K2Y23_25305 [Cyanobacteria bacterium]|nr:hypothetical protein [Cyanobacteriota bacterium]
MNQEVVETVLGRGPIRAESLGMHAHLICDGQHFSGRAPGLEIVPGAGLGSGDGRPISSNELPERVAIHVRILPSATEPRRRAQAIAGLCRPQPSRHRHCYSVEETDGQFFLTMELMEGRVAGRCGVVDRAVKIALLDFGLAKLAEMPTAAAEATAMPMRHSGRMVRPA